jgi:hypothetical protein
MNKLLVFILFNLLMGCLPDTPVRDLTSDEQTVTTGDQSGITDVDEDYEADDLTWYHQGNYVQVLTLDVDNKLLGYLRGTAVENYLKTRSYTNETYCVVVNFNSAVTNPTKQYRVRAVPDRALDFVTGNYFHFFRLLFDGSESNSLCNLSTETDSGVTAAPTDLVTNTENVCPTCTGIIESKTDDVKLYLKQSNGNLKQVSENLLDTSVLKFRIDQNSNTQNEPPACTDSECKNKGFGCCLEGQCVNHREVRDSAANADPTNYEIAKLLVAADPSAAYDYPQFYYLCLTREEDAENIPEDPGDPVDENNQLVTQMFADYECLTELETNSDVVPFHQEPYNGTPGDYSKCDVTDTNATNFYKTVLKRLYINCGCSEAVGKTVAQINYDDAVQNCPAYTYTPIYEGGNLARIECVSPQPIEEDLPFQDLDVVVPARSAPHRFFDTAGTEIDIEASNPATTVQEGDPFAYLDEAGLIPLNGEFNMNSILGQMKVDLSGAYPAKVIDVDFDKTYLISALPGSGQVTLCQDCGRDSWFENFSAFSTTSFGVGLKAVGHTTSRDDYVTNLTLGNYEDTIFGRACFLPPTMLAFSHVQGGTVQAQRMNRLQTQAALYANGYRKDWYGFNQGALIGSFDGVTWFAVGKGRIARSTSDKLYLAINAPFADLSIATNLVVAIQEYDGQSLAASWEWDPTLSKNHVQQNEAGSCREYHMCEVDTDCITKLGWEYSCVDVNKYNTQWPLFNNENAVERTDALATGPIYFHSLNQDLPPGSTNKRCVYRGAGAVCTKAYTNINDVELRKALTCAPNFYCAGISDNTPVFNSEVARFSSPLEELLEPINHLFGQDAFVLGRPKHYVFGSGLTSLPNEVVSTLQDNIELIHPTVGTDAGICRPGKRLPDYTSATNTSNIFPSEQHAAADSKYRTDYISQIAGCNSTLYTDKRYSSCPMIDNDGNYLHLTDTFLGSNDDTKRAYLELYAGSQNACGMESLDINAITGQGIPASSVEAYSPFALIEKGPLNEISSIFEPTLARDACFRKPGAVCHTDLDCSPSKLHANMVDLMPPEMFGNTAEKKYWEEYMVCGQAEPKPFPSEVNFTDYDMTKNRCCREVGLDLSMYSENMSGPDYTFTQGLRTDTFGGYQPKNQNRYSRFSNVRTTISTVNRTAEPALFNRVSADTTDADQDGNLDATDVSILTIDQWKTIHESGKKTCCGGGWIRKFDDGTHNWAKTRLADLEVENFKCLNYMTPLITTDNPTAFDSSLTAAFLNNDVKYLCSDPSAQTGGCAHITFSSSSLLPDPPSFNTDDSTFIINTDPAWSEWADNIFSFNYLRSADSEDMTFLDWDQQEGPDNKRSNVYVYIPSWIPFDDISSVSLEAISDQATPTACSAETNAGDILSLTSPKDTTGADVAPCEYEFDTSNRTLKVSYTTAIIGLNTSYALDNPLGLILEYTAPGTEAWEVLKHGAGPADTSISSNDLLEHRRSLKPESYIYYLRRLSRLEYLGIPQMTYEPLYCNNNYQKMVPGIFNSTFQTVHDFIDPTNGTFIDDVYVESLTDSSITGAQRPWATDLIGTAELDADQINTLHVTTDENIQLDRIFSPHEFMCCMELGGETSDVSRCCSGYGVATRLSGNTQLYECKLPAGTDLHVYFNKFVSSEGMRDDMPVLPLVESDFDPRTGEPKLTTNIFQKLSAIGNTYCDSGSVRRGGVFGNFDPEPFGDGNRAVGSYFSITDSDFDNDNASVTSRGYTAFYEGFRWNNHIYCDKN